MPPVVVVSDELRKESGIGGFPSAPLRHTSSGMDEKPAAPNVLTNDSCATPAAAPPRPRSTSNQAARPQQRLPRALVLFLGVAGMIGFGVVTACIPVVHGKSFQAKTMWAEYVAWFRAAGCVLGAAWNFFSTRRKFPKLPNWHLATTVQGACYCALAILVAYANSRLQDHEHDDHDEDQNNDEVIYYFLRAIAWSGYFLVLLAGIGSAILNSSMFGFMSKLSDPLGPYCFSIGQGLASVVLAVFGFTDFVQHLLFPVAALSSVALFLWAAGVLGVCFFRQNDALREEFSEGVYGGICRRVCGSSRPQESANGAGWREVGKADNDVVVDVQEEIVLLEAGASDEDSECDAGADGAEDGENDTTRTLLRRSGHCADMRTDECLTTPAILRASTASALAPRPGNHFEQRGAAQPFLRTSSNTSSKTDDHAAVAVRESAGENEQLLVLSKMAENEEEEPQQRSVWSIFCDASLLIVAKFVNMVVLMLVFPVLCAQTYPAAASSGDQDPDSAEQEQIKFKTRIIVTVGVCDVIGRAACDLVVRGVKKVGSLMVCGSADRGRGEEAAANAGAADAASSSCDAPAKDGDIEKEKDDVEKVLLESSSSGSGRGRRERDSYYMAIPLPAQLLGHDVDRKSDLRGPASTTVAAPGEDATAGAEHDPERPSCLFQWLLLAAAVIRGAVFIPLLLCIRDLSRVEQVHLNALASSKGDPHHGEQEPFFHLPEQSNGFLNADATKFAAFSLFGAFGGAVTSLTVMNVGKTVAVKSEKQLVGTMLSFAVVLGLLVGQSCTRLQPFRLPA